MSGEVDKIQLTLKEFMAIPTADPRTRLDCFRWGLWKRPITGGRWLLVQFIPDADGDNNPERRYWEIEGRGEE